MRRPVLEVVYEDADVLVVNKPPGLITASTPREKRPTLLKQVRAYLEKTDPQARVGLIHRLDRDAGGLLVFSKNNRAYHALKAQFLQHSVTRVYHAVVMGIPNPPTGRIESRLVERADGTVYSTNDPRRGQHAITEYELIQARAKRALLRLKLHTGRKHQIRSHLARINHPIVGDPLYGPNNQKEKPMYLLATELGFIHPRTDRAGEFKIEIPKLFLDAI
jgi:23S rRNA pseudouridine1911/1915/1917 synthase